MNDIIVTLLNALTLISVLMLVALGLAIIYGLMGVLNLAHGDFLTIGAYCLAATQAFGGSYWLALVFAPVFGYFFGVLIETLLIRKLYLNPMTAIIATWGLGLVLRQVIQLTIGAAPQTVTTPFPDAVSLVGVTYPAHRLFVIVAAGTVAAGTIAFFRFTNLGLDIRAVIQNRAMAESLGIDTSRVYRRAFGIGAALAAFAGVLIAPFTVVIAQMGINYLARSFLVVIIGGSGSIAGVVAGGGFVGGLETLFGHDLPPTIAQALVLALATIIIRVRPLGLTGGRAVK